MIATTRIILADDHRLVRAGLRMLLEEIPGVAVVGEAGTGREALHLVQSAHPDLLLVDLVMPDMSGLEVVRIVRNEHPGVRVMVLSMYTNQEYVLEVMRLGVAGYLVKDAAVQELELALRTVRSGRRYLSPCVEERLPPRPSNNGNGHGPRFQRLTPRQREVLNLMVSGCSTRQIADRLGVSVKTVESHRANLMDRLGIHTVAGLVRYACELGIADIG